MVSAESEYRPNLVSGVSRAKVCSHPVIAMETM